VSWRRSAGHFAPSLRVLNNRPRVSLNMSSTTGAVPESAPLWRCDSLYLPVARNRSSQHSGHLPPPFVRLQALESSRKEKRNSALMSPCHHLTRTIRRPPFESKFFENGDIFLSLAAITSVFPEKFPQRLGPTDESECFRGPNAGSSDRRPKNAIPAV